MLLLYTEEDVLCAQKSYKYTLLNFELFHRTVGDGIKNKQEFLNIWRRNRLRGCVINIKYSRLYIVK